MERVFSLSQVHFNIFELSCKKLLTNNYNRLTICLQDARASRRNKMLDSIYEAVVEVMGEDYEVEYLDGNSNAIIFTIDGEQFLVQKR